MANIIDRKSISISGLPSTFWQKDRLMNMVINPSDATVNVVLTLDTGQYIAYVGYPDKSYLKPEYRRDDTILYHCNKIRSYDQVARLGDRLDDVSRKSIFPGRS